jgi:hypothetical protein
MLQSGKVAQFREDFTTDYTDYTDEGRDGSPRRPRAGRLPDSKSGSLPANSLSGKSAVQFSLVAAGRALLGAMALWLAPMNASALIQVGRGNAPVQDAGWPDGALALANLSSRVGWWEGPPYGGGEWHFAYHGDMAAFNQALVAFAAIRAPALDLVIRDGPKNDDILQERVDWGFTVWNPASWNRLYNNPRFSFPSSDDRMHKPVDPPCLTVYVGGGQVDWAKVTVPPQVHVRDERSAAAGVDLSGGSILQAEFFDMDTGKPVPGAHLIVDRMTWTTNSTPQWKSERIADAAGDDSGRVRIEKIPAGDFQGWVRVTAEGYAPRLLDQRSLLHPAMAKYTVELAKAAHLSGVVTDSEGKPVKGATVHPQDMLGLNGRSYDNGQQYEAYDKSAVQTDETGHFEIANLATGYAQLNVTAPGYSFGDISTLYDVPSEGVKLRLNRAGGIQVSVTDSSGKALATHGGLPLMVFVEAADGPKTGSWGGGATVKADGTFEFNNVPPGDYRLTCRTNPSRGEQGPPAQIITVKPGAPVIVKFVYE